VNKVREGRKEAKKERKKKKTDVKDLQKEGGRRKE
jgi:hypothetical protein